ncbi:MAG: FAD-binding oxidoreductase [Boseongicola sp.]
MHCAADDAFRAVLAAQVPTECFRDIAPTYLEDPRGNLSGTAGLVLAPRNVDEVSTIVRACAAAHVAIVPFGGGTGLVGGQIMIDGPAPVILSIERMRSIRDVLPEEAVIVVEAGATLADVQAAAASHDLLFPLSLAAEGTCQIGGNLATNAGGVNVLRYGSARDLCIGIEAVLPDGQIWNGLTRLRKDNTGFDLRNLLIGSEGALGVITAASLKLFPRPASNSTALLAVESPAAALKMLARARKSMGEMISAFELIQRTGFDFLAETMPDLRLPFDESPDWMVLIELGLPKGLNGEEALTELFAHGLEVEWVYDGLIAQSEGQRADFWNAREHIPEANRLIGAVASHDLSLPLGNLPAFIDAATSGIADIGLLRINCFGHLGDGNLHFNAFPPEGEDRAPYMHLKPKVERLVHDLVHAHQGSFSAEHGIGRNKVSDLERYTDPAKFAALKAIKHALDPRGIMNPGVIIAGD